MDFDEWHKKNGYDKYYHTFDEMLEAGQKQIFDNDSDEFS